MKQLTGPWQGVIGERFVFAVCSNARPPSLPAFIWGMYVASETRRGGAGTVLMERAMRYAAAELRVRRVNLGVNTEDRAAPALYRKFAFKEYGHERGFLLVEGVPYDEYQMVCHVANVT